jgi:hypothetical protein
VVVVTEQEASHNAAALTERFVEALNYCAALFDYLEVVAARGSVERVRGAVAPGRGDQEHRGLRRRGAAGAARAAGAVGGADGASEEEEKGRERKRARESWAAAARVLLGHGDVARADVDG